MKPKELQHFRELLLAERDTLLQDARRHGQIPNERVDADDNDLTDQANVAVARDLSSKIAKSEDLLLQKITFALQRIEQGTYGACADCDGDIPMERLRAKPSVSLCVECQTLKEKSA